MFPVSKNTILTQYGKYVKKMGKVFNFDYGNFDFENGNFEFNFELDLGVGGWLLMMIGDAMTPF